MLGGLRLASTPAHGVRRPVVPLVPVIVAVAGW